MSDIRNIQTVILAAGRGTRLGTLTAETPKPLVMVSGKPFLAHLIVAMRAQGLRRFVIIAAYKADQIVRFAQERSTPESPISVCVAPEDLGTGGHLKYAEPLLDDTFLLAFGDTYFPLSYETLFKRFSESGKRMVMGVTRSIPPGVIPNIRIDAEEKLVLKYRKNVSDPLFDCVDGGMIIMDRSCLSYLPDRGNPASLEQYVYEAMVRENNLGAYLAPQTFYDIGTLEGLTRYEHYLSGS